MALRRLATLVRAARQVVHLGLGHRHRRPCPPLGRGDRTLLLHRHHVGLPGLEPGSERPRRLGCGLAADRGREAPQRARRRRAREHAQPQPGAVDGSRPAAGGGGGEAAGRVLVDQRAVAAAGQQPRHREIGGVRALTVGPRGHAGLYVAVVLRPHRPVRDVVLGLPPAALDRVRALAEAEEALAGRRGELQPRGRRPRRRRHLHRDRTLAGRARGHPRARRDRGGHQLRATALAEADRERLVAHRGRQGAGADLLRRGPGRDGCAGQDGERWHKQAP